MKIFAIRDATDETGKDLAYLLYYEIVKKFHIELPESADIWETPLLLDSFLKKGEFSVNSYWSKIWVQQRIVPSDRQNIAQILRDNGLESYDEFGLLMLSGGRCEQDDYYLVPISEELLPEEIVLRFKRKVEDAVPLPDFSLLVFFSDGTVRKCELSAFFKAESKFSILLKSPDYFAHVQIQTGGHGVQWDENLSISCTLLYETGTQVPLTADDFKIFATERIITATEAAELLNCSRQYINELVKSDKLHPIKRTEKSTLFLKSEVLQRIWY